MGNVGERETRRERESRSTGGGEASRRMSNSSVRQPACANANLIYCCNKSVSNQYRRLVNGLGKVLILSPESTSYDAFSATGIFLVDTLVPASKTCSKRPVYRKNSCMGTIIQK